MNFLSNYGLFLAKLLSVLVGIFLLVSIVFAMRAKTRMKNQGKLVVKKLNEVYDHYQQTLAQVVHNKLEFKWHVKEKKKNEKKKLKAATKLKKQSETSDANFFVINFDGDVRASAVDGLREEVTAILSFAKENDQVLVKINSGGGMVNAYGLAASQLERIKAAKLKLTVAIDKVAASGGYLMACVADHIIAAPFAIVGSIGVIAQLPNFHRYLQKRAIDFEQIIAGNFKRTLTIFGENTEKGREKLQEEVNITHELFKSFIHDNRAIIPIEEVATGEHWFATQALDLKLVDELKTSDDFLLATSKNFGIYEVCYKIKRGWSQRLALGAQAYFTKLVSKNTICEL